MAARRSRLQAELRALDDPERPWPVDEIVDALELIAPARKGLLDHFANTRQATISQRELMDMFLDDLDQRTGFWWPPLLRVCGIGQKGFRSVAAGQTNMNFGPRCEEAWRQRLAKLDLTWGITLESLVSTQMRTHLGR